VTIFSISEGLFKEGRELLIRKSQKTINPDIKNNLQNEHNNMQIFILSYKMDNGI